MNLEDLTEAGPMESEVTSEQRRAGPDGSASRNEVSVQGRVGCIQRAWIGLQTQAPSVYFLSGAFCDTFPNGKIIPGLASQIS